MLGMSSFPPRETSITENIDTPLSSFLENEREQNIPSTPPCTSTPASNAVRAPLNYHTPVQERHNNCVSADKVRQIMQELLIENDRKNHERWLQYEQSVLKLQQQKLDYKTRLSMCERQLQDVQGRVQTCERNIEMRDQKIRDLEARINDRENADARPKVRPDLSEISLTPLDAEKTNEHDTHVAAPVLDVNAVEQIKTFSRTKRIFVANLTRKMYSMEERIRDCNVSGTRNRPSISPTKSRYERICRYTSQHYNCNLDSSLQSEVRKVIDDTNRRFRDDLKIRKFKKTEGAAAAGNIVQHNFDDL